MSSTSNQEPSSPSSAPTPAGLPEFLVDRSLGTKAVPAVLRSAGFVVRTIDDVFGKRRVADIEWMRAADDHNWVVATKDDRIRRRPAEREAFANSTLRAFCLPVGNLRSLEQARRFEDNIPSIRRVINEAGPWMYGVYTDRIERLQLYG